MTVTSSNSVGNISSTSAWLDENLRLFCLRLRGLKNKDAELSSVLIDLDFYSAKYHAMTGRKLSDARILEIGYGARPNRLLSLISMGYAATGIDLDKPILVGSLTDFLSIYRRNGFKRTLKSLVRHFVFDRHERAALSRVLKTRGARLKIDDSKFLVGDAGGFEFSPESIDFIYSEDVVEHIQKESLVSLCRNMSQALSPNGLVLISPAVFSGIAGGHLLEWYPHTLREPVQRKSEPWEHLRKRRFNADCFLNELRVHEFKQIFEEYFTVVDIININYGLGREHLTPDVKADLHSFSEEELLSHKWTFVLQKKSGIHDESNLNSHPD